MRGAFFWAIFLGLTFCLASNEAHAQAKKEDALGEGPPIQLEGVWQATYETSVDWIIPVVGSSTQRVKVRSEWSITTNGLYFKAKEKVCDVQFESSNAMIKMGVSPKAYAGLSGSLYAGKWQLGTAGWSLATRPLQRFIGLKKPWPDAMPDAPTADQLVDTDNDSSPGITLFLRGIIGADLRAIQEDNITFEGFPEGDKIVGTVRWKWVRKLLYSSNPGVSEIPQERWNPVKGTRTFTLSRVDTLSCAQEGGEN